MFYTLPKKWIKNGGKNCLNAESRILWKSTRSEIHKTCFKQVQDWRTFHKESVSHTDRILRPNSIKVWKDTTKSKTGGESFCFDTAKLWNNISHEIKNASSIGIARNAIKKFAKTIEIWRTISNGLDKSWPYERLRWRPRLIYLFIYLSKSYIF